MTTFELLKNRCSCRAFSDEEITEDVMDRLLAAATFAPSSGGFQNYSVIKVSKAEKKETLAKLCRNQMFIVKAPVNFIFCIDLHREKRIAESFFGVPNTQYGYEEFVMLTVDTAIAAHNLCIEAEAEGLGTVYIGNILNYQDQVSRLLNLPELVVPIIMVVVGHPKVKGHLSGKFGPTALVHEEVYEEKDLDILLQEFYRKYKGWNMKPNEKLLNIIEKTSVTFCGKDYAKAGRKKQLEKGWIDPLSFWNGFYYSNRDGMLTFEEHLQYLKKQGFIRDGNKVCKQENKDE